MLTMRSNHIVAHWLRYSSLCIAAAALTGCKTLPSNPVTEALNISSKPQTLKLPAAPEVRDWVDMEQEVINNRATNAGLVNIPSVQKYLDALLQQIRTEAGVPNWPGKVYINADSSQLNAYTQGSGNIYINMGLLNVMETEDELIGLLAHEFAHTYLQYEQLQKTVVDTDRASDVATVMTLVGQNINHKDLDKSLKEEKALRSAAAVLMTYQLARNLLAPAWTRSQEYAADDMAVQLSVRMGYSVPDGWVRVLERMHDHEKKREVIKDEQRETQRKEFEALRSAEFSKPKGDVGGAVINEVLGNLSFVGADLTGFLTKSHPDIDKRIARVNELHDKLIGEQEWPEKRVGEWKKIKEHRSVQRIFTSYLNAANAQAVVGTPRAAEASKLARMSLVAETQGHVLPALANMQAQGRIDNSVLTALRANMRSPQNRAWRSYILVAEHELNSGRKKSAQHTLDEGFKHFERSPLALQDYIQMQVRFGNMDKAKTLSTECAQKYPAYKAGCQRVAQAPQAPQASKDGRISADFGWMQKLLGR